MLLDLSWCFVGVEADDVFLEKGGFGPRVFFLWSWGAQSQPVVSVCCHSAETPSFELCLPSHSPSRLRPFLPTEDELYCSVTPQQDISPLSAQQRELKNAGWAFVLHFYFHYGKLDSVHEHCSKHLLMQLDVSYTRGCCLRVVILIKNLCCNNLLHYRVP